MNIREPLSRDLDDVNACADKTVEFLNRSIQTRKVVMKFSLQP